MTQKFLNLITKFLNLFIKCFITYTTIDFEKVCIVTSKKLVLLKSNNKQINYLQEKKIGLLFIDNCIQCSLIISTILLKLCESEHLTIKKKKLLFRWNNLV